MEVPSWFRDSIATWTEHPAQMARELFNFEPDKWQEEGLESFPMTKRMAFKACAGPGKAQPKTTVIPTPDGLRIFGNLRVGDRVFTADGSITAVRAIYERGVLPIYRVSFDDGCSTLACGEHLWKVRGRTERRHLKIRQSGKWTDRTEFNSLVQGGYVTPADGWSILTTEQIVERNKAPDGSRRQFEIPRQGPVQFAARALPLDPYVLGVWLGDGVRKAGKYATKPTREIQQEIERRGYETSVPQKGIVGIYGISGHLRKLGVLPCYSHERFVPDDYLQASIHDRTDLLCGLMDTDGGVDADGHMQFATTSPDLADDVEWLARSLGGSAHRAKIKKPFYYGKNHEKILGRDCHRLVLRLPFNPFRVPERKARWKDPTKSATSLRYMTRYIDKIEPDGEADCMCIEVDHPSHLYLTNDFIVTHNTAVLAILGWNFTICHLDSMVGCTSITGPNLSSGLWTELARWRSKAPLLESLFEQTSKAIFFKERPKTWRIEARTWSADADANQIGNALRGLHADYIMWLLDETGDYPEAIMPICESIFAGSPKEAHIVQAGNPLKKSGPLYRATMSPDLWKTISITADPDDPMRTPRVSVEHARQMIAEYGRDNPWIRVTIFGQFPDADFNALIGIDECLAATKRVYRLSDIESSAKVLGIDVGREGDDPSVICPRQGLQMFEMSTYRNIDGIQGGALANRKWTDWAADAAFVDNTGGFGSSWVDQLRVLGRTPVPVNFSSEAHDKARYFNKRTEMAMDLVAWIRRGGAIPKHDEFLKALTQTNYAFKGDRMIIEPKDAIKKKLGFSPDHFDAAMLTLAEPVVPKAAVRAAQPMQAEYNPFASLNQRVADAAGGYDPFGGQR